MYRPEPDQDKAQRQANLLLVFVIGVLIGASLVAIIAISQCGASEGNPRVVDNERVVTREVRKVMDVPKVVTREVEIDVTREVVLMRVVTRVVTKEVDAPRVVTRVVEIIDGTPTIPTSTPTPTNTPVPTNTPAPPTATLQPSTPTPSPDDELCELWRDYGVEMAPLAKGLIEILASEVDLLVQAEKNPPVIWTKEWQAKVRGSLTESDFSARTISRTKAPDQFERRIRPIDTAVRSLLERNAVIRNAFDNPESAEDWEEFVPALRKVVELMQDLLNAQIDEAAIQFDVCDTFGRIFQTAEVMETHLYVHSLIDVVVENG